MRTAKQQRASMRIARQMLSELQSEFDVIMRSPKGTVARMDALERIRDGVDTVIVHVQNIDPEHMDAGWHDARDELERLVKAELDNELGDCCVCHERMLAEEEGAMNPDAVSKLPCNHRVHAKCALRILQRASGKCPLCRAPFVSDGFGFISPPLG